MDVFGGLMRDSRQYLRDAASAAAHELGLFAALPCPAGALAGRLGVAPRRLLALVRVLLSDGVLVETGGALRAAAVPPSGKVARGGWGDLAEVIRTDRPCAADPDLRRFHQHLWSAGAAAAREVAERLGRRGPLLDLGGGAGAYAAAYLEAHPGSRATIVDRPAVLELAQQTVPGAERVPLDLLADAGWPGGAGIALFANVLHLYGPDDAARLIARAARSVSRGGIVAVKDFDLDCEAGLLFSLNMAIFTDRGEVHRAPLIQLWLEGAGARELEIVRLGCSPDSILVRGFFG